MIIDYQRLSDDALYGVAKQFVLSQLSEVEESPQIDDWTKQIIGRLHLGELVIEYSEVDGSVTIKPLQEIKLLDTITN